MHNQKIREALKHAKMTQWELANILGISEQTMYRRLRSELAETEQDRIISIIKENAR